MLEITKPLVLISDPLSSGWDADDYAGLKGAAEYIENSGLDSLIELWGALDV